MGRVNTGILAAVIMTLGRGMLSTIIPVDFRLMEEDPTAHTTTENNNRIN